MADLTILRSLWVQEGNLALGNRFHAMIEMLTNEGVSITLAGCFSSGKSTLLNSLIGRNLLPVKDLPETGASCHLRSGAMDRAEIVTGEALREIECCEPAIREYVALRCGSQGDLNLKARKAVKIRITLADAPIPSRVFWIDSPGFNDTTEMEERARSTIKDSDVVVWVLSSKQFLREYEQELIAELSYERGTDGVVLLLNACLESDAHEDWDTFLTDNLPVHLNKLEEVALEMGFPEDEPPRMLVASARAMANDGRFGGEAVQHFLQSIDSCKCLTVMRTRIRRVHLELAAIRDVLAAEIERLGTEIDEQEERSMRLQTAAAKRNQFFREAAADTLAGFRSALQTEVERAGRVFEERIAKDGVTPNKDYGVELNQALNAAFGQCFDQLQTNVKNISSRWDDLDLAPDTATRLHCLLEPREVSLKKVNNELQGSGVAAGAAGGAALGAWFFGIGAVPGAIIGAIAGAVRDINQACKKDSDELRECVRTAVGEFCQQQERIADDALELLMSCVAVTAAEDAEPVAQKESLKAKEHRLAQVRLLVEASAELLERG